jgi:hypothetical protein
VSVLDRLGEPESLGDALVVPVRRVVAETHAVDECVGVAEGLAEAQSVADGDGESLGLGVDESDFRGEADTHDDAENVGVHEAVRGALAVVETELVTERDCVPVGDPLDALVAERE